MGIHFLIILIYAKLGPRPSSLGCLWSIDSSTCTSQCKSRASDTLGSALVFCPIWIHVISHTGKVEQGGHGIGYCRTLTPPGTWLPLKRIAKLGYYLKTVWGPGKTRTHCGGNIAWRDHVSQMFTRFATRATFVADTNAASWTQKNGSERFQKHLLRTHGAQQMLPTFSTDGQHRRAQRCCHNVSSFRRPPRKEPVYCQFVHITDI